MGCRVQPLFKCIWSTFTRMHRFSLRFFKILHKSAYLHCMHAFVWLILTKWRLIFELVYVCVMCIVHQYRSQYHFGLKKSSAAIKNSHLVFCFHVQFVQSSLLESRKNIEGRLEIRPASTLLWLIIVFGS